MAALNVQLPLGRGAQGGAPGIESARADWRVRGLENAGSAGAAPAVDTRTCTNCGRQGIPAANYDMHSAICLRQTWKCESCHYVMPAAEKQVHLDAVLSIDSAFAAAMEGGVTALQAFLDHGGDKDACNALSDRLLHVAVRSGKVAVTKLLLDYKADTSLTNAILDNPLQIAMKHNHKDVLLMLMKHNKKMRKAQKNGARLPMPRGLAAPLCDVTNTAGGSSKSASAGAGASALVPCSHFHGVVKVCGPGEDICGNCGEVVPTANLALHELRCKRQSFRCPHCSELVPASERDAHLDTSEATILAAGSAGMCVCVIMCVFMCVCVCIYTYIDTYMYICKLCKICKLMPVVG
jgi:hypothetical protein